MSKVAICTHSVSNGFKTGESYEASQKPGRKDTVIIGPGYIGKVKGDEITVYGCGDRVMATFNTAEAPEPKKSKSLMKMLVRAYVNHAKGRGWGDSKNGANFSWSHANVNSANEWAREMAIGEDQDAIREDAEKEGQPLDQDFVNWYVDEQMSYY